MWTPKLSNYQKLLAYLVEPKLLEDYNIFFDGSIAVIGEKESGVRAYIHQH